MTTLASQAWDLVAAPPGTTPHWLALRAGRASGGIARDPSVLERLAEQTDFSLYLGVNPTGSARRPRAHEITHLSTIFLDIDPVEPTAQPFRFAEELLSHAEHLLGSRLDPYLIDSGRGAQLWLPCSPTPFTSETHRQHWRFRVGIFFRALATLTAHSQWGCRLDTSGADLPRVGRLPGSFNHKTGRRSLIVGTPDRPRSTILQDLIDRFALAASSETIPHLSRCARSVQPARWQEAIELIPHATARIFLTEGVSEPGRHSAAWHTARSLRELGVPLEGALRAVRFGGRLCRPELRTTEGDRAVHCAYKEAMDGHREGSNRL